MNHICIAGEGSFCDRASGDSVVILSGLAITEADGLHDDGWCWPIVKLRLTVEGPCSEIRVGVWVKPEGGEKDRTVFTITSDKASAMVEVVPFGAPVEIGLPVTMTAGDAINLRISTPHRASKGADVRDLSFVLLSLVAV